MNRNGYKDNFKGSFFIMYSDLGSGDFRFALSKEDIIYSDKVCDDYCVVYNPIELFSVYDPFIKLYENRVNSGDVISYENPHKMSFMSKRLVMVIRGLLLINKGIDDLGIKKMAIFVKRNYTNSGTISYEALFRMIKELSALDNESYLRENHPDKFICKYVFYKKDCALSSSEKSAITNKEIGFVFRRKRRLFIDDGIDFLSGKDSITKISNTRISSVTGLNRNSVMRSISVRQRIRVKNLNLNRYFKKESTSNKFMEFIDRYEDLSEMTVRDIKKELNISQSTLDKFIELVYLKEI